jgi:hypothetical protein
VRELRITGNAAKRAAILAGGSLTHLWSLRSLNLWVENYF